MKKFFIMMLIVTMSFAMFGCGESKQEKMKKIEEEKAEKIHNDIANNPPAKIW